MKVVLVDDEYYSLMRLKMELESIENIEIVGTYLRGKDLLDDLDILKPDLVFLDIEMDDMNGFELFSLILEKNSLIHIIFVTAYSIFAADAFELNALDYVLKPVTQERLIKSIDRLNPVPELINKRLFFRCFQRFSIILDNKEINLEWRTSKALELMAYLIYEKGKYVSKEKLSEILWPESENDKGISKLYLAYYYIKKQEKITGMSFPIESERGRMRVNYDDLSCDIKEFDEIIMKCKTIDPVNISLAEKAEELYIGGLFEDNYYNWSLFEQQKYEILYHDLLKKTIKYYKENGNYEKHKYYKVLLKKLYS